MKSVCGCDCIEIRIRLPEYIQESDFRLRFDGSTAPDSTDEGIIHVIGPSRSLLKRQIQAKEPIQIVTLIRQRSAGSRIRSSIEARNRQIKPPSVFRIHCRSKLHSATRRETERVPVSGNTPTTLLVFPAFECSAAAWRERASDPLPSQIFAICCSCR